MPRKRKQARITHRTHPAKVFRAPDGYCQWCHQEILSSAFKTFCGSLCKDVYSVHTDPKRWREEVWLQDRGICRECGVKHPIDGDWEADHVLPLLLAGLDWNFWSVLNGQVLCRDPCHLIKTKNDAILYAVDTPKRRRRTR